jgi:WhiB family redox-sensing transcriptional regulator
VTHTDSTKPAHVRRNLKSSNIDSFCAEPETFTLEQYHRQVPVAPTVPGERPEPVPSVERAWEAVMHARRGTEWMRDAACKGMNPALFFPNRGDNRAIRAARKVCDGCPVREKCDIYAMDNRMHHGMWGGRTEMDRKASRRRYA